MLKAALVIVSIVGGLLALGVTYYSTKFADQESISRAEKEMVRMKIERDSIYGYVAVKDSMQHFWQGQAAEVKGEVSDLRNQVAIQEQGRIDRQLGIRHIRSQEILLDSLRAIFPQIKTKIFVDSIFESDDGLWFPYLRVPLGFYRTFLIEHNNSESWKGQTRKLLTMDTLHQRIEGMQETILQLERDKTVAFQKGYDSAYTKYEELHKDYIDRLKHPELSIGFPSWGTILGSAAVGVLIGTKLEGRK